jgi:hypothetical protein
MKILLICDTLKDKILKNYVDESSNIVRLIVPDPLQIISATTLVIVDIILFSLGF